MTRAEVERTIAEARAEAREAEVAFLAVDVAEARRTIERAVGDLDSGKLESAIAQAERAIEAAWSARRLAARGLTERDGASEAAALERSSSEIARHRRLDRARRIDEARQRGRIAARWFGVRAAPPKPPEPSPQPVAAATEPPPASAAVPASGAVPG